LLCAADADAGPADGDVNTAHADAKPVNGNVDPASEIRARTAAV
jgi:hypothetical protein